MLRLRRAFGRVRTHSNKLCSPHSARLPLVALVGMTPGEFPPSSPGTFSTAARKDVQMVAPKCGVVEAASALVRGSFKHPT